MNSRRCAIFFGWLCGLLMCCAAGHAPEQSPTDLNAPGEEHKKLDVLSGTWDVTITFVVSGNERVGKATCEAKWALDGRFLRQEYSSTFAGKPFTVVRYLGFDRHKDKFVELQLESTHTDIMHNEGIMSKDGKTITCLGTHTDSISGKPVKARTVTTIMDADSFTVELNLAEADGSESKAVTLTHKRKKTE